MASYIENEHSVLYISLLVTTEIAFIVGSVTHVFIIAVNVIDWRKGRTMSTSDQVIISIMMSRMVLQSFIQLNLFWDKFCASCSYIYDFVLQIIYFSSMYSSLWLSSLLCVVFYLKISNFRTIFLLQLRKIFSKKILHFIIASLLVSIGQILLSTVVFFFTVYQFDSMNSTQATEQKQCQAIDIVVSAGMFGPLLIYLLSSLLLIISLYLHIRHMRCSGNVTSSLDVYYRIIRYATGSLFTSVLCVITSSQVVIYCSMFSFVLFSFIWTFLGTLHSMLLIFATPKLKTPFSMILMDLSNCWIKREEPRDLAMTVTT